MEGGGRRNFQLGFGCNVRPPRGSRGAAPEKFPIFDLPDALKLLFQTSYFNKTSKNSAHCHCFISKISNYGEFLIFLQGSMKFPGDFRDFSRGNFFSRVFQGSPGFPGVVGHPVYHIISPHHSLNDLVNLGSRGSVILPICPLSSTTTLNNWIQIHSQLWIGFSHVFE